MYDSIMVLQSMLLDLKAARKTYGNEHKLALLDCRIRNLEKAIKVLLLINNNHESFEKWANEQIDNQIATTTEDSDSVSMFLRRQAE